jgi:class 3 adenylate cyclase/tetratricopeptide (TPR) repeat protein
MDFYALLDQIVDLLHSRQRITYRTLKRQFDLDDVTLEDLKDELLFAHPQIADEDGRGLVWTVDTGAASATPAAAPASTAAGTHQAPAPLAYIPPHLAEKILTSRHALAGERKQVTVLFADIKDSTELIRGLDPEAAQQLLDPAIHRMMDAVHRFEGTVNQVLGDGIMALFGAPIAHEDHALRACYAALAMQTAMRPYTEEVRRIHGLELRIRVGLNAGEVVVRAIGNDLHMDYSAVGETTHLAARMEQMAMPGTIRLTAATLRLVEGLVQVIALGPVPVKGLAEPVEVFELVGASGIRQRLQAAVARGLSRFVGRETECAALVHVLERAQAGDGQVVALVGEAGVGKSRLVYEFVHSHRTQGWRVLESASVSYGKATPYFPVIDLLRRYATVEERDDPRTIRARVTGQVLTLDEGLQEAIPALLSLLEALPADSPFHTLDPPQRRQRTLEALKRVLLRESQAQPLVLVFEDLHWIDSETQALLDSLVESLPMAHVLLLINYRPEYQHGWGSKTYYTQVRLDPLPPGSAEELLRVLLGEDPSLATLKRLLIARTEGNPFFLEESVRTLVETGVLVGESGAYRLAQPLASLQQVPATVHAVLAARIDRLPPEAKHLLQTAAVIGTEVPLPLLQTIADVPEAVRHGGLAHLQAAEFLYETRLFPDHEYTFKHALTHEVAYGSVLQERRRVLHARIVEAMEALVGDRVTEQVERLAHHALRGEVWDKALAYCRQRGEKAMAQSAYREAVGCFEQGLSALPHLPEQRDTIEQAIDLRFSLRNALLPLGEHRQAFEHLRAAETLAEALNDQRRLGRAFAYLAEYFRLMGELDRAVESGERALTLATAFGDFALEVMATFFLGTAYHALGDYRRAVDCFRRNVASLTGDLIRERFGMTGLPAVMSHTWSVSCLTALGAFDEGTVRGEEAVRLAEAVDHPFSLTQAYFALGSLYLCKGDLHQAIPVLDRGLGLCQVANILTWFPAVAAALGYAYTLAGRVAEALPLLKQAAAQETSRGISASHARRVAYLSEAYLLTGHMDEATALAQSALAFARDLKARGNEAYVLWLLGEIHAHQDPLEVEAAAAHYRQALALAEALGMRPLQAHCHHGLGTLYATRVQREQAHVELSTAIELYRAMDMTFWLPQTEATLAQVEER